MRTKPKSDRQSVGRRDFLRALGAGAVGGAAAVAAPVGGEALADTENNDEKRKARYQPNSDDIKAYYRVNRYPS
jgi:hypothetical protein